MATPQHWRTQGDALVCDLRFRDFDHAMGFVEQLARRVDDYNRRPDMAIATNQVRLTIANPHNAGITAAELRLATKTSAVIDELGPR
jgi:4a-hydroxytetrahydrobiopterin dehydratase